MTLNLQQPDVWQDGNRYDIKDNAVCFSEICGAL